MEEGIVILASYKFHFIRVHENMVQHPSNNKSIIKEKHRKYKVILSPSWPGRHGECEKPGRDYSAGRAKAGCSGL